MIYNNTFNWGAIFEKVWKNSLGTLVHFNTMTMDVSGIGALQLQEWNGGSVEPVLEEIILSGRENRFNINLGLQKLFKPEEMTTPFLELGANLNYALAQKNRVHIRTLEYNIFYDYESNLQIQYGGMGWGAYAGGGYRFKVSGNYFLDFGVSLYYQDVVLFEDSPWEWSYNLFMRFAATDIFGLDALEGN